MVGLIGHAWQAPQNHATRSCTVATHSWGSNKPWIFKGLHSLEFLDEDFVDLGVIAERKRLERLGRQNNLLHAAEANLGQERAG